jgi:L-lactate dehydrogenase complex protein LldG
MASGNYGRIILIQDWLELKELNQNSGAKERMMSAIRASLAASSRFEAAYLANHAAHHSREIHVPVESLVDDPRSVVFQFAENLEAVSGKCTVVTDRSEASKLIAELTATSTTVAVSNNTLVNSLVSNADLKAAILHEPSRTELFACDAGITSAQWGIAETGTLVLESEAERHRLVSLVPPVHIAVIEANRIVETMGEVLIKFAENGLEDLSRTITFITGPSRTSDIELTLAIGVHGPAVLHVIILDEERHV